jgi:hypothetical protein
MRGLSRPTKEPHDRGAAALRAYIRQARGVTRTAANGKRERAE